MITRQDLTNGYQATQATHAALQFAVENPGLIRRWHDESNYLVVLAVENQIKLEQLAQQAFNRGLRYICFYEPDLNDELTAVVIEPGKKTGRLCANIPLALKAGETDRKIQKVK